MSTHTPTAEQLNNLLPQTQCRECGYDGCLPYAEALIANQAAINLCAPGGHIVMHDLATTLGKPPIAPQKLQTPHLAVIDEAACIGCTACIRACPVDAIMGASKQMHTVIADECTGCGLCVPPCPVDCIDMVAVSDTILPRARTLAHSSTPRFAAAEHARRRYEHHEARLKRIAAERQHYLAEKAAAFKQQAAQATAAPSKPIVNTADLVARAMAKAKAQQHQRSVPANRSEYQAQQIEADKKRAAYRRAQRDLQYGTPEEQTAALAFLRAYKAEQEQNNPS